MASNKFATILQKNSPKITVVLVYTALEWTLILLLLLNSLFSLLISRFAAFFGLKPPCLWCSRLDSLRSASLNSFHGLVCDAHAAEISNLSFCSFHRRLAPSRHLCEDCSSSHPRNTSIAFISIVNDVSKDPALAAAADHHKLLSCSCCGAALATAGGFYSSYLLFKPSWGVLDYDHSKKKEDQREENFIEGSDEEDDGGLLISDRSRSDCPSDRDDDGHDHRIGVWQGHEEIGANSDGSAASKCCAAERTEDEDEDGDSGRLDCPATRFEFEETEGEDEIGSIDSRIFNEGAAADASQSAASTDESEILVLAVEDASAEILNPRAGKLSSADRLVPVELIDSLMAEDCVCKRDSEEIEKHENHATNSNEQTLLGGGESEIDTRSEMLGVADENESISFFPVKESENGDLIIDFDAFQAVAGDIDDTKEAAKKNSNECIASEGGITVISTDGKLENSVGGGNDKKVDKPLSREEILPVAGVEDSPESYNAALPSKSCDKPLVDEEQVRKQAKELIQEGQVCCLASEPELEIESVEMIGQNSNQNLATCSELNEVEDKLPETPTFYMENIHTLHKRLIFEKRDSGTESLDGSVTSEIEGGEVLTIDRLKSALKAECKALNALYSELEEERSASAIAANQTMAMITRLQEEKAAMQMEALQYQRMMEEQAEYDQEALQLLNELMVKREKEKQELEKEVEIYRKKVLLYEAKEKRMMMKEKGKRTGGISSASSSAEDCDELSVDLNERDTTLFGTRDSNQNTPVEEVLTVGAGHDSMRQLNMLDESLANFEDERLSILEQLKSLEEKLFTLADEKEHFEDIKSIEDYLIENVNESGENFELCNHHDNGFAGGSIEESDANGMTCHEGRNMTYKAKTLLPLFDAVSMEEEEGPNGEQDPATAPRKSVSLFADNKKLAIEEEVDHVYQRLQALEADREFLKHCISSLKKGDKGMDLLQEILQHLRDLRNVELRARSSSDFLS